LSKKQRRIRDMRAYSRGTFIRLGLFGLLLIFVIGNLLIRLIYGPEAVGLSLSCMSVALIPGLLIVGILALMSWVVKRSRDDGSDPD
jgi:hypothetical protein